MQGKPRPAWAENTNVSEFLITRVGQSMALRAQNRQRVWPGLQGCVVGGFGGAPGMAGVMDNALQPLLTMIPHAEVVYGGEMLLPVLPSCR